MMFNFYTMGLQLFMAKGHTRYCRLVCRPHKQKQQEVV